MAQTFWQVVKKKSINWIIKYDLDFKFLFYLEMKKWEKKVEKSFSSIYNLVWGLIFILKDMGILMSVFFSLHDIIRPQRFVKINAGLMIEMKCFWFGIIFFMGFRFGFFWFGSWQFYILENFWPCLFPWLKLGWN